MLESLNKYVFGTMVPVLLILCGIYFFVYLRCFYVSHPIKTIKALITKNNKDGISPFSALTLALAGTLGVGNIVGVSSAISLGGYGAVFWMLISALLAMILKYAEIVLAVSHRRVDKNTGLPFGGAAYYIFDYFKDKNKRVVGKVLASVFSIFCVMDSLSMGCIVQINAISSAFGGVWNFPNWVIGIALAILCVIVISGNAKWISGFTEKTIPVMTVIYILISLFAIGLRWQGVQKAIVIIIEDAFDAASLSGGVIGFLISRSLRYGVMRGLVSNEAGCGTAPIAHACADTDSPARQGVFGIFEVFIDTVILCTLTALVIILSGEDSGKYILDPMMLALRAYSSILGDWAGYFLCISVLVFGISTVICWAHYGKESLRFLSRVEFSQKIYICIYTICVFLGSVFTPTFAWSLADFAIGGMTVINLLSLFLMRREVKYETDKYFEKRTNIKKLYVNNIDKGKESKKRSSGII